MVVIVAGIGLATATHLGDLELGLRTRFGFAPLHLPRGEVFRLFTSAFLTLGGAVFYRSLTMLALCLAFAEMRVGTWRTILAFWGVHVVTLAIVSLILALPVGIFDAMRTKLLLAEHDVGPSAGYYGCLGLACQRWPTKYRVWLYAIIGLALVARLIWGILAVGSLSSPLGADIAHLVAFGLGIAVARFLLK